MIETKISLMLVDLSMPHLSTYIEPEGNWLTTYDNSRHKIVIVTKFIGEDHQDNFIDDINISKDATKVSITRKLKRLLSVLDKEHEELDF